MKTILRSLLIVPALAGAIGFRVAAQEARPDGAVGKVLLLKSERILEGEIERLGDRYRVRRGASEAWIPAEQALRLCASLDEALSQMRSRMHTGDADERLRLARWCLTNNLREQALAEAKSALEMRPSHAESISFVRSLERSQLTTQPTPPPAPAAPAATKRAPAFAKPPAAIDVNAESLSQFSQKIQPILMNACANCHSAGRAGEFQLLRPFEGGQRGATQKNLAAVLAQLNVEKPILSPLIIKAVSAHGNTPNPPIKSQQSIPYQTLTEWIDRTLATNPHLRELGASAALQSAPEGRTVFAAPKSAPTAKAASSNRVIEPPEKAPLMPLVSKMQEAGASHLRASGKTPADASSTERESPATSLDRFDPALFNRLVHPRK